MGDRTGTSLVVRLVVRRASLARTARLLLVLGETPIWLLDRSRDDSDTCEQKLNAYLMVN